MNPLIAALFASALVQTATPSVTTSSTSSTSSTSAAKVTDVAQTLTLDDALKLAATNSPTLARSAASTAIADAHAGSAFAPLLPHLSATVGARVSTPASKGGVSPIDSPLGGNDSLGVGLCLHQTLWDFGGAWLRSRSARPGASTPTTV